MLNIFSKILKRKKIILGIVVILIISGFLFISIDSAFSQNESAPEQVKIELEKQEAEKKDGTRKLGFLDYLNPVNWIPLALNWFLAIIINAVGMILTALIALLQYVASYNDFITAPPVVKGWVIVRDLCNMFFVLILLVIAFATILRVPSYEMKKTLPKLIIMAILINFSKTICGLIIDFAQVIMLTFVNGFATASSGNFTKMLGIHDILSSGPAVGKQNNTALDLFAIAGGYILALIYLVVAVVVIGTILLALVYRMVMIWIYVILSPIAYLAAAFPQGQKYSSQWWSEFTKHVIGGPVLAFFLWLSLATVSHVDVMSSSATKYEDINNQLKDNYPVAAITEAGSLDSMMKFIVSISLLIGGLIVSQQIGGAAGAIAGKGMAAIKSGAWKYSGARRVSERWGAFQAKREEERKRKAAKTGERLYGTYKGLTQGAMAGVMSYTPLGKTVGKGVEYAKGAWDKVTHKDWRDKRAKANENLYSAYDEIKEQIGLFNKEELKGEDVAEIRTVSKEGYRYTLNESGNAIDIVKEGNKAEETKDEHIMTKSVNRIAADQAYREAYSPATQVKDEIAAKTNKQLQGQYAGLSAAELRRIFMDGSYAKNKRMAAAMSLAIKDGFKTAAQMAGAKSLFGKLPTLDKEFGDAAKKRQAHLYYDITTEAGRKSIAEAAEDRSVDLTAQEAGAYATEEMIEVLRNFYGKEFIPKLNTIAQISKNHRDNTIKSLGEIIKKANTVTGADGKLDVNRIAYANISGDIKEAMKVDGKWTKESDKGLELLIEGAKVEHLGKIDVKVFSGDNAEAVKSAVGKKISLSQLKGLMNARDASQELKDEVLSAVKEAVSTGESAISKEAFNRFLKNLGQEESE